MKKITWLILLAFMAGTASATVMDESLGGGGNPPAKPAALPNSQLRVHDVGNVWLSVTNFGFFGSQENEYEDAAGIHDPAPGCEFPGGSNLDYLFQGALWVGAEIQYDSTDAFGNVITVFDTLVSIGNDGWWGTIFEFFPVEGSGLTGPGAISVRSIRPSNVYPYGDSTDAISEQDFVATYYDTVTSTLVPPDPFSGPHRPLGIEIEQRSYAWSYEYAEDFVLLDFDIKNIGQNNINKVWIGMYIDADVLHRSEGGQVGAQDDICGFKQDYVSLTGDTTEINTAWIADNDGFVFGGSGTFDYTSPRGVSGVRVVRTPALSDSLEFGFNWWISNVVSAYDWGPQLQVNYHGPFPGGGNGTPGGDNAKYQVMSNQEFDYDQIRCNLTRWEGEGWIQRSSQAADLADGYDTRYLFSFGEFPSIPPDSVLKLTAGYVCGEELHVDAANFRNNLQNSTGDETSVDRFYDNLDFTDFATNSQWASWVYDNPGVDTREPFADLDSSGEWEQGEPYRDYDGNGRYTDRDGYFGEFTPDTISTDPLVIDTFWYAGDGVPDFAGPPPPPSPILTTETSPGRVELTWDGKETEKFVDTFLKLPDFEGYRIYMSRSGQLGQYTLIADYDRVDFDFYYLDENVTPPEWKTWDQPPHTLEELLGTPIDPNDPDSPLFPADPDSLDWIANYVASSENWIPNGWNSGFDEIALGDTTYTFTITRLSETVGLYFAVTAYDFGNPVTDLSPLESSQNINAKFVYPVATGEEAGKIHVYPNPYKITDVPFYLEQAYEDRDRSGNTEVDRRIWFSGFPAKSTVRIFSLDGDLVRQLEYDPATDPSGVIDWDLISRNTQAVVSGIYIYAIESENGYEQVGKIAIIK
jgi:hypothetical protein